MKRLKKYNELFDTEELKSSHEIAMLQGNLFKNNKIRNVSSSETIYDLTSKLLYKLPFLAKFGEWEDQEEYKNMIFFQQKNDNWYANICFTIEGDNRYGVGMLYKHLDSIPNAPVKHTLTFEGKDYQYFSEWNNKTFDEIIELVNKYYLPLLNRLGFDEEISHHKKTHIRKFN